MEYAHLTKEQQQAIIDKRVADIEAQHYDTTVSKQLAEIELGRRSGPDQASLQIRIDMLQSQLDHLERTRKDLLALC